LAFAQHQHAHVSTVVVVRLLPPRVRRGITMFWMAVVCLLLAWMGLETATAAIESFDRLETRYGSVPIWPARIAVSVGIWLLVCELLVQLVALLCGSPDGADGAGTDEELSIADGL